MGDELKRCPSPWCDSNSKPSLITLRDEDPYERTRFYAVKCSCGMMGPEHLTDSDAGVAWNKRAVDLHEVRAERYKAMHRLAVMRGVRRYVQLKQREELLRDAVKLIRTLSPAHHYLCSYHKELPCDCSRRHSVQFIERASDLQIGFADE